MPETKFLLVGRGLSGAMLSFRLMERGIAHDIIDEPYLSRSSKVAAGLMNPIVLKRLKLVKDAAMFMEYAPAFYAKWEAETKNNFYHPTPIFHNFASIGEVNEWMEKSTLPLFKDLLGGIDRTEDPNLPAPFGRGELQSCGWLNTLEFLDTHLKVHQDYGSIREEEVNLKELEELSRDYDHTILCSGHLMKEMFPELDVFRPTRGEVLTIRSSEIPQTHIIHGKVFIMPVAHQVFKVGATYHWDVLNDHCSEDGLNQLKEDLSKLFKGSYEIIDHQAGVRPNVKDRKPLLGSLSGTDFHVFNGMGSRAVLMAPYLSELLVESLTQGSDIPHEYSIGRFIK